MKTVNISIFKLKVLNFSPRNTKVELSIVYGDESIKEIICNEEIENPSDSTKNIINEVIRTIKQGHRRFDEGEIIEKDIKVNIEKEAQVKRKITIFLGDIRSKVRKVVSSTESANYLNAVGSIKHMQLIL